MKKNRSKIIILSLIGCIIATLYATSSSFSQETTLKLPTTDNTSSFNVTNSADQHVLTAQGDGNAEVTGNLDVGGSVAATSFVGDGSTLSNVRPIAAYVDGDQYFQLTGTFKVIRSLNITVPAAGIIHVTASGYLDWESKNTDYARGSIVFGTGDPNDYGDATNQFFRHLFIATDSACADSSDQYSPLSMTRTVRVNTGGTYTFKLWMDDPIGSSDTAVADVTMTAMYFPTGGAGAAKAAVMDEQSEPVRPGPGIDTPDE